MPYYGYGCWTTTPANTNYYTNSTAGTNTIDIDRITNYVGENWYSSSSITWSGISITHQPIPTIPTIQELEQYRIETDAQNKRIAEEEARKQEAENKAKELLEDWLGKEGLNEMHKVGYIEVDSQKYKDRKYRVPSAHMNYIEVMEDGKIIDTLCVHPDLDCPPSDHIFSRLVLLKFSEEYLLSKSNRHGVPVR